MNTQAALSYSDIMIVPQYSEIQDLKEIDTRSRLTKNLRIDKALIASSVDSAMPISLAKTGSVGVIAQSFTADRQVEMISEVKKESKDYLVGASISNIGDFLPRAILCQEAGADFLVIESDQGHTLAAAKALELLKELGIDVIAGNVVTQEGAKFLAENGADAVRVGPPCPEAKNRSGVGVPQFSAIIDCSLVCAKYGIPVIAYESKLGPSDVVKAIAAGASSVMAGNHICGLGRSTDDIVNYLVGGLKPAMYYSNSASIEEFHEKVQFVPVISSK